MTTEPTPSLAAAQADAKAVEANATAAEKQVETAAKKPSGLNWLAVAGAVAVANLVGVFLHI